MKHNKSTRPYQKIKKNLLSSLLWVSAMCAAVGHFPQTARADFIFSTLASFNATNGYSPKGPLLQAQSGEFYGTTSFGGSTFNPATTNAGFGTVFKYSLTGGLVSLASFNSNNGAYPSTGLIQTSNGLFYGTTSSGGVYGAGTVFRMTGGAIGSIASFDGTNGNIPNGLTKLNDQIFYGLSYEGGYPSGNGYTTLGTIFKVDTNGALSLVKKFDGSTNGANPLASMVMANDGSFFGTATSGSGNNIYGTTFHFFTNGALSVLDTFAFTNGAAPTSLILGQDGYYYGTANQAGKFSAGTIFRMSSNGVLTNLYYFDSTNSGGAPGSLVQGRNGLIYGVASGGGSFGGGTNNGGGTIFQITTNGQFSIVYVFTNGVDGSVPSGLIIGNDDNLYGTTSYGGSNGYGTIFSLAINPINPVITSLKSSRGLITINWSASAGYTYNVLYKNTLASTNWSLLQTVTASNSIGVATDVIGTNASRFYRVVVLENVAPLVTAVNVTTNMTTIKWNAIEGYTYEIFYKTTPTQTNWTALETVMATNPNGLAIDTSAGGVTRYYEVLAVSPSPNITSLKVGSSQSTLQWVASPGSTYNVLFKSSLTTNWSVFQTVTARGPAGYLNFNTPTNAMGFFQVQFSP